MKICTVKHHFIFWFLFHQVEVLPFDGNWNDFVALFDDKNNLLSDISKHGSYIHIEDYGLEVSLTEFKKILATPNASVIDLVKNAKNIIKLSDDEYEIAKFAKENNLKYGHLYANAKLFYFIVAKTIPCCDMDSYIFIDPNNPFV